MIQQKEDDLLFVAALRGNKGGNESNKTQFHLSVRRHPTCRWLLEFGGLIETSPNVHAEYINLEEATTNTSCDILYGE